MCRISLLLLLLCLLFPISDGFGQEDDQLLPDISIPASPTSIALAKYGSYPVDLSNGLPSISIPIYTVKQGSLEVPIQLNYHASGFRVNEEASIVGLGWSLNAGGMISRTVNGYPDELGGDLSNVPDIDDVRDLMNVDPKDFDNVYLKNLAEGKSTNSFQPDLYNYNINGVSGSFVVGNDNEVKQIPKKKIKIENDWSQITTSNGVEYVFHKRLLSNKSDITEYYHSAEHASDFSFESTWYVQQVISANKMDTIIFDYESNGYTLNDHLFSQSAGYRYRTDDSAEYGDPLITRIIQDKVEYTKISTQRLKEIKYKNGRVRFVYDDRFDTNGTIKKLKEVIVEKLSQGSYETVQNFELKTSYFGTSIIEPLNQDGTNPYGNYIGHRLRLDGVYEKISETDISKVEYDELELPNKMSFSQDHWGYFNDKTNRSLIPKHTWETLTGRVWEFGDADRSTDAIKMKACIIKSIEYPTKGKTVFDFEANRYYGEDKFNNNATTQLSLSLTGSGNAGIDPISLPPPSPEEENLNYKSECFRSSVNQRVELSLGVEFWGDQVEDKHAAAGAKLYDNTDNEVVFEIPYTLTQYTKSENKIVQLKSGHQYCLILRTYSNKVKATGSLSYDASDSSDRDVVVGGLRIKYISNYDVNNEFLGKRRYSYENSLDPGKSSGKFCGPFLGSPVYEKGHDNFKSILYEGDTFSGCLNEVYSITDIFSNAIVGVYGTNVMYQYVSEWEEDSDGITNGRKDLEFSFYSDYSYSKETPVISNSWRRGEKIVESVWKNEGGTPILVKRDSFFYKNDDRKLEVVSGFKLHQHVTVESYCDMEGNAYALTLDLMYEPASYEYRSMWRYLSSHKQVVFDDNGQNPVSQTTDFYYDNQDHMQPTRVETTNSIGEKVSEISKYPDDYADDYANILKLKDNYIVGIPIQKESKKNGKTIGGSYFKYNDYGQPEEVYTFYDLNETTPNGDIPANYKRKSSYSYDPISLKLIQHTPENDMPTSYVWGYNYQLPVASVKGIDYSSLVSHLGGQSKVDLLQDLDGSGLLAALSPLYELDNTLTSLYTYDTFFGVKAQCDPNGYLTTYEYDNLGRLLKVKDHNDKIVSQNLYHFIGGSENQYPLHSYKVDVSQPINGGITPGTIKLEPGRSQKFQVIPNSNYQVKNVIIDGVSQGSVQNFTITGDNDHSVSAEMELVSHQIKASSGSNGSITSTVMVVHGSSKTFNMTPNLGYKVKRVLVDGTNVGSETSYLFPNVTEPHTISVEFEIIQFDLTTTASNGGSISNSSKVNYGSNAVVAITPNTGYQVSNVSSNYTYTVSGNNYTFTNVTSAVNINADFAINQYNVSTSSGSGGSISASSQVNHGSSRSVTITPSTGYHLVSVNANRTYTVSGNIYTFSNVTSNVSISATFAIDTFIISSTSGVGGTITAGGSVNYGSSKSFFFYPMPGFHIQDVKVDGLSQGILSKYTFSNVRATHTIHVDYAIDTFTLSSSSIGGGSITSSSTVNYGSSKTFLIIPSSNYKISSVTVDGISKGAISSYTFSNVTTKHTIHAVFTYDPPTYYITTSSSGYGSISSGGSVTEGGSKTIYIYPDATVKNFSVYIDGVNYGKIYHYTFTNVTKNHSISANFNKSGGGGLPPM